MLREVATEYGVHARIVTRPAYQRGQGLYRLNLRTL